MTDNGTSTASYAGNAFAGFLLGQPDFPSSTVYAGFQHYRRREAGVYIQDDWKGTRHLTLNLGLRWEIIGKLYETNGQWRGVDLLVPNVAAGNLPGALVFASQLKRRSMELLLGLPQMNQYDAAPQPSLCLLRLVRRPL
jgi:TonB dependent receptor